MRYRLTGARSTALFALAVFVVALVVRVHFVTHAHVYPFDRGDAGQYLAYAWNLVRHGTFSGSVGDGPIIADAFRAPGYPVFLAAFLAKYGEDAYMPVLLAQSALGAMAVVFGALLARRAAGTPAAIAVALLGVAWPHLVTSSAYLLSEALYGFLVAATLWAFAGIERRRPVVHAGIAGAGAALAWLTNPVCAPAWVLLGVASAWRGQRRAALAFLLVFALAPLGWAIRNAVAVDTAAQGASDRAWVNLVQGSHPEYHIVHRERLANAMTPAAVDAWSEMNAEIATGRESRREGMRVVLARLARTPVDSFVWYARYKLAELWGWDIAVGQGTYYVYPTYRSPYETEGLFRAISSICFGLNPLVALAALFGIAVAVTRVVRRRTPIPSATWATALTLVATTAVHLVLQAEPRYAVPYRMLEFIAAAFAVQVAVGWLRARRGRTKGATL
ncbi:hypothetical protein [Lysobacter sp. HA35]